MIDWLEKVDNHNKDGFAYPLDAAKKFEIVDLCCGGKLILNIDENKIDFAVMEFYSSGVNDTNVLLSEIFHGVGFAGGLRECRHTYWGGDWGGEGYVFYPNGKIIADAFEKLSKYFDDMA